MGKNKEKVGSEIWRNDGERSKKQRGSKNRKSKFANLKVGGILAEVAQAIPRKVAVG